MKVINRVIEGWLASFIGWVFSFEKVQEAFVESVFDSMTIGHELQTLIENRAEKMICDSLEEFQRDFEPEIDADNVDGLESFIENTMDSHINDIDDINRELDNLDTEVKRLTEKLEALVKLQAEQAA